MRYSPLLLVVAFAVISFVSAAPTGQAIESIDQLGVNDIDQLIEDLVETVGDEVDVIVIADDDEDTLQKTKANFLVVDSSPSDSRHKKFFKYFKFTVRTKTLFRFMKYDYRFRGQLKSSQ